MIIKEVIQVISDIGQSDFYVQEDNHYDCLVLREWLINLKRNDWTIKAQARTVK